jgi:outer membrane protein assembly factor BamB
LAVFIIGSTLLSAMTEGADWAQFRGPNNSGIASDWKAPTEWSATKNLVWKQTVPGYGWSSPIVVGDKLFVTTAVSEKQKRPQPFNFGGGGFGPRGGGGDDSPNPQGPTGGGFGGGRGGPGGFGGFGDAKPPDDLYRWEIHCLDRNTGKTLWSQVAVERKPAIPATMGNTYASETPVSDGERVYAYFGAHGLYCYDLAGKQLWKRDFGSFPMMMSWGTASSPALDGGRLFILADNEQKSFLVALDVKSGDELWRVERDEKSSWSTPFVWRNKVRTELVTVGGKAVRSYDPTNGKLIWELKRAGAGGRGPNSVNATPVGDETMLYVGSGNPFGGSPLWAVKVGAKGDISLDANESTNNYVAWSNNKGGPPLSSPLLYEGHLYILAQQNALLTCYDAKTGNEVYKERVKGAKSFTSSPWAHAGKIYCLDESGQTFVIRAGPQFEQLGKNEIEDMFWATPAVARDALYLRGADNIYCIKQ